MVELHHDTVIWHNEGSLENTDTIGSDNTKLRAKTCRIELHEPFIAHSSSPCLTVSTRFVQSTAPSPQDWNSVADVCIHCGCCMNEVWMTHISPSVAMSVSIAAAA